MKKSYTLNSQLKEKLDSKKNRKRKLSSQMWLTRQINDIYVKSAKAEGYYSRSAYKLLEINNKFHILKPSMKVIDTGAAPGGWSQVVANIIFKKENFQKGDAKSQLMETAKLVKETQLVEEAQLIAVDLLPIKPVTKAEFIQGDFTDPAVLEQIKVALKGSTVDVILSDMAPNTTGIQSLDHLKIMALVEIVFQLALSVLSKNGAMVVKVFQGGATNTILQQIKQKFKVVKHYKPPASRTKSTEIYLIAMGFKG
ncbi:Ribosomal RNA large subunit methyltransferase E [Candidatus Hepatincola sp. Av]